MKKFDLNIERVLEDWELYHAIREVIANALDEQVLTATKDIQIYEDSNHNWHIRDFGRGLRYTHLTQKENDEKLRKSNLIGKFGVGLKDALATFDRKNIKVLIKSVHGDISLEMSQKHDFHDINTLHACVSPPTEQTIAGTDFVLSGCKIQDVEKAKDLFLCFSGESKLETTANGEVLKKGNGAARIYINGVRVAEEEKFLFSYNITSITKTIKKALNRERTNVGRTAYSDAIKTILLKCQSKEVAARLVHDLAGYESGGMHDELKWSDVSVHACKLLNSEKVVFLTPAQLTNAKDMVDEARKGGFRIVTIPDSIREKIGGQSDFAGKPLRDLEEFKREWNEAFEFKFVEAKDLKPRERAVFERTKEILNLIGGKPNNVKIIKISETMRKDGLSFVEAEGIWERSTGRIIIKRSQLRSIRDYAGTLLHEMAHARSGAEDVSREFEHELTTLLGLVASIPLK